jgi:predicted metal-dependent phosphoesterase TrpH
MNHLMVKVELHTHTSDDPSDRIPYTTHDLIDRAAILGYGALAVTLHNRQLDLRPLEAYAMERGIVLIPGIERTIQGRHVLLLNFDHGATDQVETFDDVRRLKEQGSGLVIAPHPFFPAASSLRSWMHRYADVFDAVEYNAMYTSSLNFNGLAERWAQDHGKPIVGNCDVHRLEQLGTTYSLVDAQPNAAAICGAIAAGRVTLVSRPISWAAAVRVIGSLYLSKYFEGASRSPRPSHVPA